MTSGSNPSLLTLPIELVCRVLDHLNPLDILLSIRDVCTRLDAISDTYYPYQVRCSHPLTLTPLLLWIDLYNSLAGTLRLRLFLDQTDC